MSAFIQLLSNTERTFGMAIGFGIKVTHTLHASNGPTCIPKRMNFMTHDNERPNLREPLLHCRQVDCRSMLIGRSHAACIPCITSCLVGENHPS